MKVYATLTLAMAVFCLVLFGVVSVLEVPLLTDPRPWLGRGTVLAAITGLSLLWADVLLPVPASLVMIANGALFGFAMGAFLSLIGGVGAALFGFFLGRRGRSWIQRIVSNEERLRVESLLSNWGALAVVVSRPVPILAESMAVLAGTSEMPWRRFLAASIAGCIPAAVVYAVAGALAATLDSLPWIFALVLAIAGSFHVLGGWMRRAPVAQK